MKGGFTVDPYPSRDIRDPPVMKFARDNVDGSTMNAERVFVPVDDVRVLLFVEGSGCGGDFQGVKVCCVYEASAPPNEPEQREEEEE